MKILFAILLAVLVSGLVTAQAVNCQISPNNVRAYVGEQKIITIKCFNAQQQETPCPILRWYSDSNAIKIRPLGEPLGAVFWFKYYVPKVKITAQPYYQQQPNFACSINAYAIYVPMKTVSD